MTNKKSNKKRDILLNIKTLMKRNKKITVACFLLLFSIGIYFVAFSQDEDQYADKFSVAVLGDSNVLTGSEPFDQCVRDNGEFYQCNDVSKQLDSNDSNNKVRNFDSVTYNIKYLLQSKTDNDPDLSGLTLDRKVIADILVPSDVSIGGITTSINNYKNDVVKKVTLDGVEYNYYSITSSAKYSYSRYESASQEGENFSITFNSINTRSNSFSPIISLRESTDSDISEPTDEGYNGQNMIPFDYRTLSVVGIEKYKIKAFAGNILKSSSSNSEVPFGVMTYLPVTEGYGIKGIKVPSTISYNVSASEEDSHATLTYKEIEGSEGQVRLYNSNSGYMIGNMPYSPSGSNAESLNGTATIDGTAVTIQDFSFDGNTKYGTEGYALTTNAFVYDLNRNESTSDFDISFEATENSNTSRVTVTSSVNDVVGDLAARVRFIDASDYETGTLTQSQSSPTYNLNEEFYTRVTLNYVNTENTIGDTLTKGMDTYIKLDNRAIKLLHTNDTDIVNVTVGGIHKYDTDDSFSYDVSYGVGDWNLNSFTTSSTCESLSSDDEFLTEKLMNLYGGPCLSDNSIIWKSEEDILGNNEDLNRIMMIKIHFNKIYTGTRINVIMKTSIKDSANVGENYQVVTSSTTKVGNSKYYLTDQANDTNNEYGIELMSNPENYFREITGGRTESPEKKYGNTLLVSIVKAKIHKISAWEQDEIEKTQFVTGADEPIVWRINASAKVANISNLNVEKGTINVYVPNDLIYYIHDINKQPTEEEKDVEKNGNLYTKYTFEISPEEIGADGEINEIKIYTNIMPDIASNTSLKLIADIDFEVAQTTIGEDSVENKVYTKCVDPIENREKSSKEITIINNRKISVSGYSTPQLINLNQPYDYKMLTYNNYNKSSGSNLSLVSILPFNDEGDETTHSAFSGKLKVKIESLPQGYNAYYTNADPKSILSNELNNTSNNGWTSWSDPSSEVTDVTAIKITSTNKVAYRSYFGSNEGIHVTVTPVNNSLGDEYSNKFYIVDNDEHNYYESNDSLVSVYNRQVSGFVFEDYNYNGLSDSDEQRLSDLNVELYKLSNVPEENINEKDVLDYMSDSDELIDKTTTGENGNYKFRGLEEGYYYVVISYDDSKYVVADYEKVQESKQNSTTINSKFLTNSKISKAVSKVIHLDDNNIKQDYINLGLRVRLQFGIEIEKYITNVKVISNKGVDSYDYDRAKQVKINLKNLKNTSIEVTYGFELKNSKYFPGYVGSIVDIMPEGMTFDSKLKDNYGWTNNNGVLTYSGLANTLITPSEKYDFKLKLNVTGEEARSYLNVVVAGDTSLMSIINGVDYGSIDDISGLQDKEEQEEGVTE